MTDGFATYPAPPAAEAAGTVPLLPGGARIAAIVTRASTEALGLRLKQTVIVLVKSSAVLATDLQGAEVSARNRLDGVVTAVTPGAVNAVISIEAEGGVPVVAIVTQASVRPCRSNRVRR